MPIPETTSHSDAASRRAMIVSPTTVGRLAASGPAWRALKAVADRPLGTPDLADQDSRLAGVAMGAALVYVRTGRKAYRDKVIGHLAAIPRAPLGSATVLSVGRQLAGYAIAADLVGFRSAAFVAFMRTIRTRDLGDHGRWHSLEQTARDTPSNWGANALASWLAASLYVGDRAEVRQAARVFMGFTGRREIYVFRRPLGLDAGWVCTPARWRPINPDSCGDRGGALALDISRSKEPYPSVSDDGLMYSWGALGPAMVSAKLLSRAGYEGVYLWGDKALLRAAQFLHGRQAYPPAYGGSQYVPWMVNRAYDTRLGPLRPAGVGRMYGFTDWLP